MFENYDELRQKLLDELRLTCMDVDIDALIADGILEPSSRGWYKLLDSKRLPKHAGAQIISMDTDGRIKFSKSRKRARASWKKLTGEKFEE